jgi:hypothetical protein
MAAKILDALCDFFVITDIGLAVGGNIFNSKTDKD